MRRNFFDRIEDWGHQYARWVNRGPEGPRWTLIVGTIVIGFLLITASAPVFLGLAILAAIALFARAWLREFSFLMGVDDSAFPGRSDKLIWALLLIVLPPVGVYLFRAHRRAYWPESDAKATMVADELA
jgi:hypothetical protein